jgi:hypothetical protein
MLNFCTHFNIKYLTKAIALHESMLKQIRNFKLFMFVFDDVSFAVIKKLSLPNVELIHYNTFETNELKKVKSERSTKEYLWTVTPFLISFVIEKYNVQTCTYIDADIYFFNDPSLVFLEADDFTTIITEHRYNQNYDQTNSSGRFCVQFNSFTNSDRSLKVLNDWKASVYEWCFDKQGNGLFGDQMYLDSWPFKYNDVHIVKHPGAGVAPWNILSYSNLENVGELTCTYENREQTIKVIFYHFHGLLLYSSKIADLGNYRIGKQVLKYIYRPYLQSLKNANNIISEDLKTKDVFTPFHWSLKNILRQIKRMKNNIFNMVKY